MPPSQPAYSTDTSDKKVIEVSNVSLTLQGKRILENISFSGSERRIGVVGRNGSGKTTLARVIAGLVTPDAGQVRIAGVDVARNRTKAIATVGILFQNPDHQIIFPTVEEEVAFGLTQLGQSKAQAQAGAERILEEFGKSHWATAAVHELSQGQKQLLCLMSVFAMSPKLILLDEPFSGLDLPTRTQLERYLREFDAQVVHISHDPAVLADYDRVLWIDEGRVLVDGAAMPTLAAFTEKMTELGGKDDISDLAS